MRELYDEFKDRAAFLFVYVTEPGHIIPELGPLAVSSGPDADSPEVRRRRIARGLEVFDLPFACLVDEDGKAEAAYAAYPQRLVVVGTDGRIAYNAGPAELLHGLAVAVGPTGALIPLGLADSGSPGTMSPWDLKAVEARLRYDLAGSLH